MDGASDNFHGMIRHSNIHGNLKFEKGFNFHFFDERKIESCGIFLISNLDIVCLFLCLRGDEVGCSGWAQQEGVERNRQQCCTSSQKWRLGSVYNRKPYKFSFHVVHMKALYLLISSYLLILFRKNTAIQKNRVAPLHRPLTRFA